MEEWKDVKGYDGRYSVSNKGRVRRNEWIGARKGGVKVKYKQMIISTPLNDDGYPCLNLTKEHVKKSKKAHRLVAEAFVDNPNGHVEVNHIDENKANNNADNLEWCTRKENMNHGTAIERMKNHPNILKERELSKKPVISIHIKTHEVEAFESISNVEEHGFKRRNVWSVIHGYDKTHQERIWMFVEDYNPDDKLKLIKEVTPNKTFQLDDEGNVLNVFENTIEAGKVVGVHPSNISRAIKNNRKSAGYYWEYRKPLQ